MSFLKPFLKTILISGLLFFALVFLGMKYHWIGFTQGADDENLTLKIPHQSQVLKSKTSTDDVLSQSQNKDEDDNFQPQIIQTTRTSTLVDNMTKVQVTEYCVQFLRRTITDSDVLMLAVGDCVLSNYRDSIIKTLPEEGELQSTQSRQAQTRRNSIIKGCQQRVNSEKHENEVEKQLLLGICVSGKAK